MLVCTGRIEGSAEYKKVSRANRQTEIRGARQRRAVSSTCNHPVPSRGLGKTEGKGTMTDLQTKTTAVLAAIAVGSLSLDRVRELHAVGRQQMKDTRLKNRKEVTP